MPNILEVEGIGQIKMPDEWSPEQIQEWARTRLPRVREDLKLTRPQEAVPFTLRALGRSGWDTVKGLARGFQLQQDAVTEQALQEAALGAAQTSPPDKRAEVFRALQASADETTKKLRDTQEQRLQQNPVYRTAEEQEQLGTEYYRTNPLFEQTLPNQAIVAATSTLPMVAAGAAGPAAPLAAALAYGAMTGQQGAEEAIRYGHPEKAELAFILNAGLGMLSEAALGYPIHFLRQVRAARQAGVTPDAFGEAWKAASRTALADRARRVGQEIATAAPREFAQEGTEQLGQNVIAGPVLGYDPNRPLMQNVPQAAAMGGAVGALFGGVSGTALAFDEPRRNQQMILESFDRPLPPALADALTREQMRPEFAQRTVVPIPAMLQPQFADQPATGLPAEISTPQPLSPPNLVQQSLEFLRSNQLVPVSAADWKTFVDGLEAEHARRPFGDTEEVLRFIDTGTREVSPRPGPVSPPSVAPQAPPPGVTLSEAPQPEPPSAPVVAAPTAPDPIPYKDDLEHLARQLYGNNRGQEFSAFSREAEQRIQTGEDPAKVMNDIRYKAGFRNQRNEPTTPPEPAPAPEPPVRRRSPAAPARKLLAAPPVTPEPTPAPESTKGRVFEDRYLATDKRGYVISNFRTEAEAKKAAGKGGTVERRENAVEIIDVNKLVSESDYIGRNDSGDPIYFHAGRGPYGEFFTIRHGRLNFGGDAVPTAQSELEMLRAAETRNLPPPGTPPIPASQTVPVPPPTPEVPSAVQAASSGEIAYEWFDEPRGVWVETRRPITVTRNTIPGEKPWRITAWLPDFSNPTIHADISSPEEAFTDATLARLQPGLDRYVRNVRFSTQPRTQETPDATVRQRISEKVSLGQTPEARPPLVQEIRQPEAPAGAQAAQPAGQVTQWLQNLGSVDPESLKLAKTIKSDIQKLDRERIALESDIAAVRQRITHQTGPKWQRGKIKKSAKKSDLAEYEELQARRDTVQRSISEMRSATQPDAIAAAIKTASDESKPLFTRLMARRELFYLQGQQQPEEFDKAFDAEVRKEVRKAFPDANAAEEDRLRGPVQRAFMGQDPQSAFRLDPELNLNAARWNEISKVAYQAQPELVRFPEALQAKISQAQAILNARKEVPPISRAEVDALLTEIPKASEAARAEIAKEEKEAAEAAAKMEIEFTKAIKTETARDAKAAKTILVRELEAALAAAPEEQHGKASVTIEIPGDGTFKIQNNKQSVQAVLDNARALTTATGRPANYVSRGVSGEQAKQFLEEARMTPEEVAEWNESQSPVQQALRARRQAIWTVLKEAEPHGGVNSQAQERNFIIKAAKLLEGLNITKADLDQARKRTIVPGQTVMYATPAKLLNGLEELGLLSPGKLSVTLKDTPTAGVTSADIAAAFPASQGFAVKAVAISFPNEPDTTGFLVILPNGETILIDPRRDTIAFDAAKSAADWGLDPAEVAKRGVAVGKWTANGVTIPGLSRTGLIELINTAGPDTLSHEKFHALFELALTPEDRTAILNRYKTEEKAAEAFRRSEGFTRGFWDTMRRFIEWLANLVRGDAFRQLRAPLREDFVSEPTGRTDPQLSLETAFQSPQNLERFIEKETISPEVSIQLRDQAGAQAALIPDSIAEEIEGLNPEDAVEKRMASLLNFVTQIHGLSVAIDLRRILNSDLHPEDLKQAAISGVLRQVQRVEVNAKEIDDKLQDSIKTMASLMKARGRIEKQHLIEERSKRIAQNLVAGYKAYLTAQAATLPADSNVAAARQQLLNRMDGMLNDITRLPSSTMKALEAIAERIDELPVAEGPQAVIDAIRTKDILRGKAGDHTIEMLTEEKPGGLPPLLLDPGINQALIELADLQRNADRYAKQIEVVEQAFRGKGEPTPVQLRKWAETYRKFRNKQADAAKAIAEYDKEFAKADEDVTVYGRSKDVLDRLQASPEYQAQMRLALARPGGEIRSDLYQTGKERATDPTKETVYVSPLRHLDEDGKEIKPQNTFRVHLAPNVQADAAAVEQMKLLVEEITQYLDGANGPVDPISERTWSERRDYLKQYVIHPKFLQEDAGSTWANPFNWGRFIFGGLSSSLRGELEAIGLRASEEADREVRTAEKATTGYRILSNNPEFGDAATTVAVINAVKSHNWETDRIKFWNQYVLNPIIAAGQTAGQMRLKAGDYVPGTDIQITKEDMIVAGMEKRFSQGVVQTTQGTAKGLPSLLRNNPVLIQDTFSGRPVLRGAMSPGPLTMARSFSTWGRGFDLAWHKANPDEHRRIVQDGDNFQMAVLGYIRTTNPEFENNSPLLKVYEKFAKDSKDDPTYKVNSMDQLLDKLADIAVDQGLFENKTDAIPQIEATLMAEIGRHAAAIRAQFAEEHPTSEDVPQEVMQFASSQSAFTKPRKRMVAPDPYYDYTLTHESDRISFVAAGLQQFQLRIISAIEALQTALGLQQSQLDAEIANLYSQGMSERKARKTVNKRTAQQLGNLRFSYTQLLEHKRRLDKMHKSMKELVIDVRNPNDSPLIAALTRGHSLLSSGLLANPTAIGNNLAGGILSAKNVTLRNLGQSRSFWDVKAHSGLVSETIKKLLRAVPGTTAIGALARSNLPVVREMAGWVNDSLQEQIQREADAESFGLISRADLRNRMRARGELMTTAGQIDYESPKGVAAVINAVGSVPGVRHALGQLRDKIPGAFDRFMNTNNARFYQDTLFLDLKNLAIKAFKAREEMAARNNLNLDDVNDFSQEANLLTPKELNRPKASGYRDAGRLRQLFSTVGSLDAFLLDYYNRYKAAPEGEKADVQLFEDPADEGAIIHDIEAHENIATAGFTPLAFQGVGQRGLLKKMLFMFRNYPTRMFHQMSRMLATDPRDPKGRRELANWWGVLVLLIVSALAGLIGKEVSSPIQQAITGRSPSFVKLSNVLENPDAGMLARYVGMGLASNLPYYGGVISQILGNPGYGTWLDAAEYIPAAGLVKDAGLALRRTAQTGDPIFPATDFIARWFPPASPALRLIPDVAGDIEGRNAARALRVVGPSAGMELAGGAGATYKQTPATLETRRLLAAAYRGDADGIKEAFEAAVRERAAAGSADPERAVMQSIAAAVPARRVFGRSITAAEEARLTSLMSGAGRADYAQSRDAFDLINRTLGTTTSLTSQPRARRTLAGRRRRALRGSSRLPRIRRVRSRARGRRRSPFGFRQPTVRRRRRSPTFATAA